MFVELTPLSRKIVDDWGTVKHFCKKHDINYNTFRYVVSGNGVSAPIVKVLKEHGYIKNASDLKKKSA